MQLLNIKHSNMRKGQMHWNPLLQIDKGALQIALSTYVTEQLLLFLL